jgi:DNA-directed RNA polymerase specialized sigma24 family protein
LPGIATVTISVAIDLFRSDKQERTMDDWWAEIDDQLRSCLERHGEMAPAEIARQLGLSEGAVTSLLSLLAQEGKLRIARVELPRRDDGRQLSL